MLHAKNTTFRKYIKKASPPHGKVEMLESEIMN